MESQGYSQDNPFAPKYSADNPFAQKEEPQGPLEHILETGKGFIKSTFDDAALAIEALGSPYPNMGKVKLGMKLQQQQQIAEAAAPIFRKDLTEFFDAFSKEQFNKVLNDMDLSLKGDESLGEIAAKPFKLAGKSLAPFGKFSTYGNLASGVVDMLTRPVELMSGENFSQDARPLTPEESAERAKHLLGDAVMVLVTHNVSGAINRGLVGKAITEATEKGVEGLTSEQLLKVAKGPKVGEIGRKVISNVTGGAVGGFTGGLVSGSGSDNSLENALLQGVMGIPLGFAQEYAAAGIRNLRGKVLDTPEEVVIVAQSIFDERQLKLYKDDSVESAMNKLEALKTSDNLSEAAKKLGTTIPRDEPLILKTMRELYDNPDITEADKRLLMGDENFEALNRGYDDKPLSIKILEDQAPYISGELAKKFPKLHEPLAKTGQPFNFELFKQNLYNGFREFAFARFSVLDAELPAGWDFDKKLSSYLSLKKIPQEYLPAIREDMMGRLSKEFYDSLEPHEKSAIDRLKFDLNRASKLQADDYTARANYANKKAQDAGMYVDKDQNGVLVLKSRETGEKIMNLRDETNLMDGFVSNSGKPGGGLKLGNGLDAGIPIKPPPVNPLPTGGQGAAFSPRYGRLERLLDTFNVSRFGSGLTAVKDVFSSLDNLNKTNFVGRVWDITQVGYRQLLSKLYPLQKTIGTINDKWKKILTTDDWIHVSRYRQQESAADLVNRFNGSRGVSPIEIDQGKWLADNDIDVAKVSEYRRAIAKLDKMELSDAERGQRITELQTRLGMDSKHLEAYTRFQTILSGDRNVSDLSAVIAYANALKSGMTRAEYAAKFKLDPKIIKASEELDAYYNQLAKALGVSSRQELERRITQWQRYKDFPPFEQGPQPNEGFIRSMANSEEIAEYEDHPITHAMRVAAAGIKQREFKPIVQAARQAMKEELSKMEGVRRANARLQVEDYLDGISGNRKFITDATIDYIAEAAKHFGKDFDAEGVKAAARRWMSNYFGITESSAQGFRPSQGLRDFYSSTTNYYIRFGQARTARALRLFNSMTKEQLEALEMQGNIGTLRPFEVVVPGDNSTAFRGQLARGTEHVLEASFGGSLQKRAYRNAHAMAFNETYINTVENIGKLIDGSLSKEQAYKNLDLHTYDPGIQVQFDNLVKNAKDPKAAATYLARLTAAETVFLYGAANQARFMSGLPGALAGQYSTWSTWESRFAARMLSRGTVKQRMRAMTRWGISQTALAAADGLTGFNLSSWFLTPANLIPRPGPTVQAVWNGADVSSANQRTQNQAIDQLQRQGQLLVPGFQALRGWGQAYDLWERGFDPGTALGRGLGVPVDEQNNNWWDVLLREGEYNVPIPFSDEPITIPVPSVGFDKGRQTIPSQILGNEVEKKPSNAGRKAVNQQ